MYRCVARRALRLQFSLYVLRAADRGAESLLDDVSGLIDEAEDDVRAYHVPRGCRTWTIGRETLPEGIALDAAEAARFLRGDAGGAPQAS